MANDYSEKTSASIKELHDISKQHETNLVIELGTDRIITWLGVYFIFVLGVFFKIEELFTGNLAYYPGSFNESVSKAFIQFASINCWEIPQNSLEIKHECIRGNMTNFDALNMAKYFIKLFPYALFLQALISLLPTVCWHLYFGSRLIGYLKLVQYILDNSCKAIINMKEVVSTGKAYDKDGVQLVGSNSFLNPVIEIALEQISNVCDWLKKNLPPVEMEREVEALSKEIDSGINKLFFYKKKPINEPQKKSHKIDKLKESCDNIKNTIKMVNKKFQEVQDLILNHSSNREQLNHNHGMQSNPNSSSAKHQKKKDKKKCQAVAIQMEADDKDRQEKSDESNCNEKNFAQVYLELYKNEKVDYDKMVTTLEIKSQKILEDGTKGLKYLLEKLNKEIEIAKALKNNADKVEKIEDIFQHFSDYIKLSNKVANKFSNFQSRIEYIAEWFEMIANKCKWIKAFDKNRISTELCCFKKFLVGKMKDCHFLSLLCYENFASLHYIPFMHLVFRICGSLAFHVEAEKADKEEKNYTDRNILDMQDCRIKPTMEAIFQAWYHPENFTGNSVVYCYVMKQVLSFIIAFVWLAIWISLAIWLGTYISSNSFYNFSCNLPNLCLICSMLRQFQLMTFIVIATLVQFIVLCLSGQKIFCLKSKYRTSDCSFFELFQFLSMHALYTTINKISGHNAIINVDQSLAQPEDEIRGTSSLLKLDQCKINQKIKSE